MAFYASVFNYEYQGVAFAVFSSANFWLTLILTNVILLVPVIAYRFYTTNIMATLSDRVRMKQRLTKSKARTRDPMIRRASTFRRSTRSLRSGYAFAHTHGFAELITSGLNMKERAGSFPRIRSPVLLTNMKKIEDPVHKNGKSEAGRPKEAGKSPNGTSSQSPASHPNAVNGSNQGSRILYTEHL